MQIDPSATRLMKVLSQMAQASQTALEAGAKGNEDETRTAVDTIRRLQANLNNIDNTVRSKLNDLSADLRAGVQEHLSQIKRAEPFIKNWCQRYSDLISFEILRKTEEGRQAILDYALPLDWNFGTDVFIIFGDDEVIFSGALKKRGQLRILAVGLVQDIHFEGDLFCAMDEGQIRDYFSKLKPPKPARVAMLSNKNKIDFQKEWEVVRHGFTISMSNSHTSELYGNSWLTQGLANLPSIARSMNMAALKTALNGLPVVIVSPGPSLDKNIHRLKGIKGRAVIMAAAQCAKALYAAGIVPDFIAVADPNNLVYFLDGVDVSQVEGLIVGVSCHPGFYTKSFKHIITFNANANIDAWISDIFGDTLPISAAGSISIDCLYFAKYIGSSHIIMVGLDLALSDGHTYSNFSANATSKVLIDSKTKTLSFINVPEEMEHVFLAKGSASEDTIEPALELPGYYGGEVITRPNYHLFHGEIVEIARVEQLSDKPTPLINSTEGGAYIPGFEHISLSNAIDKYLGEIRFDIASRVAKAYQTLDISKREQQLENTKLKMIRQIENVLRIVYRCKELSKSSKLNQINKLNKLEKKLINEIRVMPYLSLPNAKQTKIAMEMSGDASNIKETNGVANYIYDAIEITSNQILGLLRGDERIKK